MWGVNPGQFEEKYGQNSSYTCIKFAKNKLKIIIKKSNRVYVFGGLGFNT